MEPQDQGVKSERCESGKVRRVRICQQLRTKGHPEVGETDALGGGEGATDDAYLDECEKENHAVEHHNIANVVI